MPEDPARTVRIAVGSRALIAAASVLFWVMGRLGARKTIHAMERVWSRLAVRVLRLRLVVEGVEHIDPARRYVIVALHEGFADAIALFHLGIPLRFLVRDELFGWPSLGRYLRATGQVEVVEPATRSTLRKMIADIEAALASGDNLVVFAQGSILGVEIAFQDGAFRIARRMGLPMLPVVITGTHRVWEHPYAPTVRLGQVVSIRVMKPLGSDRLDEQTFRALERSMKTAALDSSTAPVRRFDPDRDGWWDDYEYEIDPDFAELANRLARRRADSS